MPQTRGTDNASGFSELRRSLRLSDLHPLLWSRARLPADLGTRRDGARSLSGGRQVHLHAGLGRHRGLRSVRAPLERRRSENDLFFI